VPSYILRQEAVESVLILYRTTGNKTLQDLAWQMFKSTQKAKETLYGDGGIDAVNALKKLHQAKELGGSECKMFLYARIVC
jgi:mannosyl-oligosaccharide alpha-1,2-mannosidase